MYLFEIGLVDLAVCKSESFLMPVIDVVLDDYDFILLCVFSMISLVNILPIHCRYVTNYVSEGFRQYTF